MRRAVAPPAPRGFFVLENHEIPLQCMNCGGSGSRGGEGGGWRGGGRRRRRRGEGEG